MCTVHRTVHRLSCYMYIPKYSKLFIQIVWETSVREVIVWETSVTRVVDCDFLYIVAFLYEYIESYLCTVCLYRAEEQQVGHHHFVLQNTSSLLRT